MYSPTLGRFITKDPIGFVAGDQNLYRFVGNEPTNVTDPSGLLADRGPTDPDKYFASHIARVNGQQVLKHDDLGSAFQEFERGCVGMTNLHLGLPRRDFPEKGATCFTTLGAAMRFFLRGSAKTLHG